MLDDFSQRLAFLVLNLRDSSGNFKLQVATSFTFNFHLHRSSCHFLWHILKILGAQLRHTCLLSSNIILLLHIETVCSLVTVKSKFDSQHVNPMTGMQRYTMPLLSKKSNYADGVG